MNIVPDQATDYITLPNIYSHSTKHTSDFSQDPVTQPSLSHPTPQLTSQQDDMIIEVDDNQQDTEIGINATDLKEMKDIVLDVERDGEEDGGDGSTGWERSGSRVLSISSEGEEPQEDVRIMGMNGGEQKVWG